MAVESAGKFDPPAFARPVRGDTEGTIQYLPLRVLKTLRRAIKLLDIRSLPA
jgi:hypothetical protein